ncbi:hypothetical protein KCU87_g408, partial [Aureobasidium melanogenum]
MLHVDHAGTKLRTSVGIASIGFRSDQMMALDDKGRIKSTEPEVSVVPSASIDVGPPVFVMVDPLSWHLSLPTVVTGKTFVRRIILLPGRDVRTVATVSTVCVMVLVEIVVGHVVVPIAVRAQLIDSARHWEYVV